VSIYGYFHRKTESAAFLSKKKVRPHFWILALSHRFLSGPDLFAIREQSQERLRMTPPNTQEYMFRYFDVLAYKQNL
jgi:hypothetical protein